MLIVHILSSVNIMIKDATVQGGVLKIPWVAVQLRPNDNFVSPSIERNFNIK